MKPTFCDPKKQFILFFDFLDASCGGLEEETQLISRHSLNFKNVNSSNLFINFALIS